jgi:hypothetical protein
MEMWLEAEHDGYIVRYAEDFVIPCKARPEVYVAVAKAVLDRLGLALNEQKTRVVRPPGSIRLPRASLRCASIEARWSDFARTTPRAQGDERGQEENPGRGPRRTAPEPLRSHSGAD